MEAIAFAVCGRWLCGQGGIWRFEEFELRIFGHERSDTIGWLASPLSLSVLYATSSFIGLRLRLFAVSWWRRARPSRLVREGLSDLTLLSTHDCIF